MKFFHKCDLNSFTCWVRVGLASLPAFDCLSPAWRRHLNSPNWFMFINHAFCITRSVWGLMLRPAFYSRAAFRDCEVDAKQAVDAVEREESSGCLLELPCPQKSLSSVYLGGRPGLPATHCHHYFSKRHHPTPTIYTSLSNLLMEIGCPGFTTSRLTSLVTLDF